MLEPVRASFDRVAERYAADFYRELDRKPFDRARLDGFAERLPRPGMVVEVGCGPGHVGRFVARTGLRVVGVDFSVGMLRVGRRLDPGFTALAADLRRLPVRDGAAAGLLAFYALIYESTPATATALGEFRRVLRPGGGLLLAVHGGEGAARFTDYHGQPVDITLHLHRPEALARMVEAAGFDVERLETREPYGFEHPTTRCYVAARAH